MNFLTALLLGGPSYASAQGPSASYATATQLKYCLKPIMTLSKKEIKILASLGLESGIVGLPFYFLPGNGIINACPCPVAVFIVLLIPIRTALRRAVRIDS